MRNKQHGFTLVELMIAVAITGILAAIAIPAYQDYTIRSQVSEGLSLSNSAKNSVNTYYADRGVFPLDNAEAGLSKAAEIAGEYVASVGIAGRLITVTYGNKAHQIIKTKAVTLTANTSKAGSVVWVCAGAGIVDKHLPAACR